MYMYYLLGYRLFGDESWSSRETLLNRVKKAVAMGNNKKRVNWLTTAKRHANAWDHCGKSDIFVNMELAILEQAIVVYTYYTVVNFLNSVLT